MVTQLKTKFLTLKLSDFSGGLNLRDAPSELAPNETPDCMNITLDERGGVVKRLGYLTLNGSALAGAPSTIFYSDVLQLTFFQIGTTLYKTADFVTVTSVKVWADTFRSAQCDFNGKVVMVHRTDGVWTYDGATMVQTAGGTNNMEAVKGDCIAAWQNKVWVGSHNSSRVYASNIGDALKWTIATDFVDIREKDDQPITAIGGGAGMDVQGRPGLLVFKSESTYRINSSNATTGFTFTTLHGTAGASGARAIASLLGITCAFSRRGIYTIDGTTMTEVSQKIEPIFRPEQMNFSALAEVAAGVKYDRVVFSFPWGAAQSVNNRTIEYHPLVGWFVMHDFGMSGFATYRKDTAKLYGSSPTATKCYEVFTTGSDDGASITARYQTPWMELSQGHRVRYRHIRLSGRGTFSLYILNDYLLGQGTLNTVAITGSGFTWNSFTWNGVGVVWGPSAYEGYQDFYSLGNSKAVSFQFTETSASSSSGPRLLADGTSPEIGNFACYGLALDYIPLGLA